MESSRSEHRRLVGWLVFSLFALVTLHSLVFYSSAELHRLWLDLIRHPRSPLATPWSFIGLQVVATIGLIMSRRLGSRVAKRAMYYFSFWTSLMGFWWYFRIEHLLVLFGISSVLMVLTLIDLKKDRLRAS